MRRLKRNRRRRKQVDALTDISMTPLIDTALTLLIIFMIATPMIQNAIRVTLPHGQAKESEGTQQELVVYLDKDGNTFLNKEKIVDAKLIDAIKQQVGVQQDKTVFVKADQAVSYGTVIELVDKIKVVGGVKYVALATQKRAQSSSSVA